MKLFTALMLLFVLSYSNLLAQAEMKLEKPGGKGSVQINEEREELEAIPLPAANVLPKETLPVFLQNARPITKGALTNEVIKSSSAKCILQPAERFAFELDTRAETITLIDPSAKLSDVAQQAIAQAPSWMEKQLTLKMQLLAKSSYDDDFGQLVLDAPQKMKDEVAAFIAYTSVQTLTDSRFLQDKEMILRNAEMIYLVDDSLQYVDLVEHNQDASDYYTTTKYRIYDPTLKDTVWSEIPKEIYYLYVVCAKMDQEGVYVKDNSSSAEQRTWGVEWRKYIWENSDPEHDYTQVNKTTSKGSITTIPRFGELMRKPRILWDRTKTYYPFNRPFEDDDNALDVIGNWASRALPVDVTLPRSFQPNQILMKHDGMCNEDAFLVTSACRTALIPTIYLGTWSEDHVFSAVWDKDWHHYEIFRGGLQPNAPSAFGITNLMDRGSYNWKNAYVEGFRPDGFPLDFTKYYADTCKFIIKVVDSTGAQMEGVMLTLYGSNTYNAQNYLLAGRFWTDANGVAQVIVGAEKKYRIKCAHPIYGSSPEDASKVYIINSANTVKNQTYSVNIPYPNKEIKKLSTENNTPPDAARYSFRAKWNVKDILTGANPHDSQQSRFYFWNDSSKGQISFFVCDSANYEKFKKKQAFTSYAYNQLTAGGDVEYALPWMGKWYVVFSNHNFASFCQSLDMEVEMIKDPEAGIGDATNEPSFTISPNPATNSIVVSGYEGSAEIINSVGMIVWKGIIRSGENLDLSAFSSGNYFLRAPGASVGFSVVK